LPENNELTKSSRSSFTIWA